MKYILIPLLAMVALPLSSASALTAKEARACNAMAASFAPKKTEFEALSTQRDKLVVEVEDAGVVWDDAEALRNFSAGHAEDADAKKAAYDDAVARFDGVEQAYRVTGAQLNEDFAAYNRKCVTDDD